MSEQKPIQTLYIANDKAEAQEYVDFISEFLGAENVAYLPENDEVFSSLGAENITFSRTRAAALYKILSGATAVITTLEATTQDLPQVTEFKQNIKTFAVNDTQNLENLAKMLVKMGFTRESMVSLWGEFSIRGDIVDIFSPNQASPIRLSFFGDTIESIKFFDVASQKSLASTPSMDIIPCAYAYSLGSTLKDYLASGYITRKIDPSSIKKRKKSPKQAQVYRGDALSEFNAGDYVVHDTFGIGECAGVQKLKSVSEKDYIVVRYKAGDILYVPVEQSNLLHRYSGSHPPKINRMTGGEFERIKDRVKSGIKRMSFDLVELYKRREAGKGFTYSPDNDLMREFEDAFPHVETEDQLRAVAEIKADMEKGVIMDRLLSGDVGFGKTEVALRAAFKTVLDGKQVALLCPTTVLCRQHFNTAQERFKNFGIKVDYLSRFKSDKEQAETLRAIANGEVDIVVGTHRLLSKDIKFADLGLLILDEEQRFGVEDKDRIKTIKANVNVLTLSATPIPRTLHMSLSGIRDISLIETPPVERLAVETYVAEFSLDIIAEAVRREMARGGQIFLVYNRVKSIYSFANKIQNLLPEARIRVAHGQMSEGELEDAIINFYDYKSDILISTTIIENGIDLRRANTLVVAQSDLLGLSQLYQLRGRVGRSNRLGYAYFLYDGKKVLTETAYKRLSAIMEFTEFNSGFRLAMRDLEIRGAGDILGREQHGHMDTVGYDMYCRLLSESLAELKGDAQKSRTEPLMDVELDAFIDGTYIEESIRFKVYRKIAAIKEIAEREKLIEELTDIYGTPPEQVKNLINIAVVKMLAAKINASKVVVKKSRTEIYFDSIDKLNNPKLLTTLKTHQSIASLNLTDLKINIKTKTQNTAQNLELLENFLLGVSS